MTVVDAKPVGVLLREWRQRRRLSQLELANAAEISARHLSFLETGRAAPSREMVLRLAQRLDLPLRERNTLLLAAGFAPMYAQRRLDDPALAAAREAVELLLAAHEPYPALAIDRHWTLVTANRAARRLMDGVDAYLLEPPVNVLRLSLHPAGLAPRIVNLAEWRAHLFARLRQQIDASADPRLDELLRELRALPAAGVSADAPTDAAVVVPLVLATPAGKLRFLSTTTVFGTPVEVTLSELAIESFFPADQDTAQRLRRLGELS
ncbi:MAG: helix-turn-helix transcriptional regulator [Burkholderiaceae bacterium]|nr:helix-turn-helix transcriptional regulator [Burkholderiaceae bacterium]